MEIVKKACKLKANVNFLDDFYNKNVIQMMKKIMADKHHPLHGNCIFKIMKKTCSV